MAKVIGGIGTSHTPIIGLAFDRDAASQPAWAPMFAGYAPVARWLQEQQPDVLVMFYNDHANGFFFDCYPTFALGIAEAYAIADEGAGPRPLPPVRGCTDLSAHLADSLVNDAFDIAVFQDRPLDHGCLAPLSMLWPCKPNWPGAVVPIAINVLQYPLPTAARCYALGQAVRRAINSYPGSLRVAVVGTGGLSHQVHGERSGFNNPEWDQTFLRLIEENPERLTIMTHAELAERGGAEGVEVIIWLAMRGALGPELICRHQSYYLPTSTAIAVALYEERGSDDVSHPRDGNSRQVSLHAQVEINP